MGRLHQYVIYLPLLLPRLLAGLTGSGSNSSGCCCIAVDGTVTAAAQDPALRSALGMDASSRVVVVATEGATDPAVYEEVVGRAASGVRFVE